MSAEFVFAPVHATEYVREGDGNVYENALTPACDFCLDTRTVWEYPCETFILKTKPVEFGSDGNWLACERCAEMIEGGHLPNLTARSLRSWTIRHGAPQPELVDSLGQIQQGFFDHRNGPRFPYKKEPHDNAMDEAMR